MATKGIPLDVALKAYEIGCSTTHEEMSSVLNRAWKLGVESGLDIFQRTHLYDIVEYARTAANEKRLLLIALKDLTNAHS